MNQRFRTSVNNWGKPVKNQANNPIHKGRTDDQQIQQMGDCEQCVITNPVNFERVIYSHGTHCSPLEVTTQYA